MRFSIDLTPAPASKRKAAPSKVKRGWLKDKVIGKAVAYVFRFVVQVAGKHVIKHLERSVSEGLIAIADAELRGGRRSQKIRRRLSNFRRIAQRACCSSCMARSPARSAASAH